MLNDLSPLILCPSPAIVALGAAYGTAKSGTGIAAMSVMRPDLIMKSVIPVVMAGIIAIYGLVVSVLIANKCKFILRLFYFNPYSLHSIFKLASFFCVQDFSSTPELNNLVNCALCCGMHEVM